MSGAGSVRAFCLRILEHGSTHDFYQGNASPIEVDFRMVRLMDRFARILLDMDALQRHLPQRTVDANRHRTTQTDRLLELTDLVILRKVGIEVVLASKHTMVAHIAAQRESKLGSADNHLLIQHW